VVRAESWATASAASNATAPNESQGTRIASPTLRHATVFPCVVWRRGVKV
jgi:hypothetical protein